MSDADDVPYSDALLLHVDAVLVISAAEDRHGPASLLATASTHLPRTRVDWTRSVSGRRRPSASADHLVQARTRHPVLRRLGVQPSQCRSWWNSGSRTRRADRRR